MDEIKLKAGEKIGALHEAAKTAAVSSKSRVNDVITQTSEAISRLREAFNQLWQHELILESRQRIVSWGHDAADRIRSGALPLSPMVLYEELVALFKDRVWRRSVLIFVCGVCVGGACGLAAGVRAAEPPARLPHARALLSHADQSVMLVDHAPSRAVGRGEVLVRVQAFSVTSLDRCVLRGHARALRSLLTSSDVTVGRGFAGVVLDVGYGVDDLELGDEVWGVMSEWYGGAASELLTVKSSRVSKRARGLSADTAASAPWAGTCALLALRRLLPTLRTYAGKRVLVVGAGSGEGCAAVQLLTMQGAIVSAAAPPKVGGSLKELGATEFIEHDSTQSHLASSLIEQHAVRRGPWDAVIVCPSGVPFEIKNTAGLLKATASRKAIVDLRNKAFISDRLPAPLFLIYAVSFYTYRVLRWAVGNGTHTDWLEDSLRLRPGLSELSRLVDEKQVTPMLDKVYYPQDFETALAHACSEEAVGTTVVRFP